MSEAKREQGQKVIGKWLDYRFGAFGRNETPIMEVLLETDAGRETTIVFMGAKPGKDGVTQTERLMQRLVDLGCDAARLKAPGWRDHIKLTMTGKEVQAEVEVYQGTASLRGLQVPGSGAVVKPVIYDDHHSPFASSGAAGGGGGSPW